MSALETLCVLGLKPSESAISSQDKRSQSLRHLVIEHPEFTRTVREIARLHERWVASQVAGALLIVGQSGAGKSTVLDYYLQRFPSRREPRRMVIPVLKVLTPEAPTVKAMSEAVLVALGDTAATRGSAAVKTNRIALFLRECRVELILFDEFHHFCDSRAPERRRVTDWLKNLLNECGKPVVLLGLPRAISALYSNEQLRRRFASPFYYKEFGFRTEEEQTLFRGLLKHFQEMSKLTWSLDLSHPDVAMRFHFATNGLIDYVVKIVDDVMARQDHNAEPVGYVHLQNAFKAQIWADVPLALNPFNPEVRPRRLDKANEPFSIWDDPKTYTLSKRASAMEGNA